MQRRGVNGGWVWMRQDGPWVDDCHSSVIGKEGFVILLSLVLYIICSFKKVFESSSRGLWCPRLWVEGWGKDSHAFVEQGWGLI